MSRFGAVLYCALCFIRTGLCTQCLKNTDIGHREGNVYNCDDPELPRCCIVEQEFTCCESMTDSVARDQLTIWGVILLVLISIGMVVICFRKDIYCFENETLKQTIQSICPSSRNRKTKYKTGKGDKEILLKGKMVNGIVNLGEPDPDEYVRNYLLPESCGVYYPHK